MLRIIWLNKRQEGDIVNRQIKSSSNAFTAAKLTALIFGVLAGLGGLTHGIGEVLQGNVKPDSIIINSWAEGPIATNMGGEPGMTIIPNLLITGILTIIVSLATIVWAAAFVQRKNGGRILILLSATMLLVGGGFGPPIIGMLAGAAGTGIGSPLRRREGMSEFLATLWPWIFGITTINGIFLVIGSVIAVYFLDVNNPDLFTNSFFVSIILLPLMIFSGRAYDVTKLMKAQ
jgi:hypothetical protein